MLSVLKAAQIGDPIYQGLTYGGTLYFTDPGADAFDYDAYPGLRAILVECQAGGGGGGGCATTGATQVAAGDSGQGGIYARRFILVSELPASPVPYSIGDGGAAGAAGGATTGDAGHGGDTWFISSSTGTHRVFAPGGRGGLGRNVFATTAAPPSLSNPLTTGVGEIVLIPPEPDRFDRNPANTACRHAQGGHSPLGLGGFTGSANSNGIAADQGYGGGGSGGNNSENQATPRAGGAGRQGILIIHLFY